MKKVRYLFLFTALITLFTGCAPLIMPADSDDYPSDYQNIEWVEITKDDAEKLFEGYSHSKIHSKAELYTQLTYGDTSVIKLCKVKGDSYYEYYLDAHTYQIDNLTVNPADWNNFEHTLKFEKSKNNINLVKISYIEDFTENYKIYENGWLKEQASITNGPKNHSYSKEYVDYK